MCVMCLTLLTDFFDAKCCLIKKILELPYPQAVTADRLDQLVYSPHCYIQMTFPGAGVEPAPVQMEVQKGVYNIIHKVNVDH